MRDQLSNRRIQLSQISSALGAQTAVAAELRRGFVRGRKPKDGLRGHAWGVEMFSTEISRQNLTNKKWPQIGGCFMVWSRKVFLMNQGFRILCLLSGLMLISNLATAETTSKDSKEGILLAQNDAAEGEATAGEGSGGWEASGEAAAEGDAAAEGEAAAGAEAAGDSTESAGAPEGEAAEGAGTETEAEMDVVAEEEPAAAEEEGAVTIGGWEMDFHGYFRGPLGITLSKRAAPDDPTGKKELQSSYFASPGRLIDGNYGSFAYTRLQEGDWGELLVTAQKEHVAATIGIMGGYYQFVGAGSAGSSWVPGVGFVTLNTDFNLGSIKPNIELKTGAFLSVYGAMGVYDTYLFSRTHMLGEALKLTLPISDNFNLAITHGFGGNKNGLFVSSFNGNGTVDGVYNDGNRAWTLAQYLTVAMNIAKIVDVGLYFNSSWSHDPSLYIITNAESDATLPFTYADWRKARMRLFGADVRLNLPRVGNLWLAYNHIALKNGFALSDAVEVMHSGGGNGIAGNYMGASGSGGMNNIAWTYDTSLQNLKGKGMGNVFPDLTLSAFGMLASVKRDLIAGETIDEKLTQLKGGMELTFWAQSWVGLMFRYDGVNLNQDVNGDGTDDGSAFHVLTPRLIFKSHFLSGESIWFQFSKYIYGDEFKGSGPAPYGNSMPDEMVFKMQCNIGW